MSNKSKVILVMFSLHTIIMILSFVVMKYVLDMDSTLVIILEGFSCQVFTGINEVVNWEYRFYSKCKQSTKLKVMQLVIDLVGVSWFLYIQAIPVIKFYDLMQNVLLFQIKIYFWYVKRKVRLFQKLSKICN